MRVNITEEADNIEEFLTDEKEGSNNKNRY
jgi:hypothetical protein